jgi:hypothetical protein
MKYQCTLAGVEPLFAQPFPLLMRRAPPMAARSGPRGIAAAVRES